MAQTCCVDGCIPTKEDVTYFKFPNSRTQRLKWLDAISTSVKVTLDTMVCSQHFLPDQYELVRGKKRLKAKVVPSVFDNMSKPNSPQKEKTNSSDSEDSIPLQRVKSVTTDTDPDQSRTSPDHRVEDRQDSENVRNGLKEDDIVKRKQPENTSIMDSESNKDIEDIIAHYQIKQIRPLHKPADVQTDRHTSDMSIEIEVPASMEMEVGVNGETGGNGEIGINGEIGRNGETGRNEEIGRNGETDDVIDVDDLAEPVFIEVSVGKGGAVEQVDEAANQDCMMLLESVQCEVDPTCLMFPPDEPGGDTGDDSDVVDLGEKKEDPVSLLTSSDEDEVIIEEPKYDMIEVSDETDEDDVPLVKLVEKPTKLPKPLKKDQKTLKKLSDGDALTKLLWGQLIEYYCMECGFSTTNKTEYKRHVRDHKTGFIQVCEICSFTTSSKHQYIRHKRKHREDRRFKCHLCNYKARHSMSLVYHLKSHDKSEGVSEKSVKSVFKCELCNFETDYKVKLSKHIRGCKGKRFYCNRCSFEADRKCDVTRHKATRHKAGHRNDDDDDYEPPK